MPDEEFAALLKNMKESMEKYVEGAQVVEKEKSV